MIKRPNGKHIFGMVKVGEKGQIVIPKEARELFHIKAGDQLMLLGDEKTGLAIITSEQLTEKILGKLDENQEEKL